MFGWVRAPGMTVLVPMPWVSLAHGPVSSGATVLSEAQDLLGPHCSRHGLVFCICREENLTDVSRLSFKGNI